MVANGPTKAKQPGQRHDAQIDNDLIALGVEHANGRSRVGHAELYPHPVARCQFRRRSRIANGAGGASDVAAGRLAKRRLVGAR